jgi:hypothetical protein
MLEYNKHNEHPYSSSCGYCHHEDELTHYKYGEDSMVFSSGEEEEYNSMEQEQQQEPFKYNYLLNLITSPDTNAYLLLNDDDIFNLPIHLQKLIIEAKEEIVFDKEKPAQKKLEKLKRLLWQRSHGDLSILMNTLVELVSDEGELEDLLRI